MYQIQTKQLNYLEFLKVLLTKKVIEKTCKKNLKTYNNDLYTS